MTFTEMAARRRSVRKFLDRAVEQGAVEEILRVTLTAPSSKNLRTTRIAVIRDAQTLEIVSKMRSRGSSFVAHAPVAFVVMGDDTQTDMWRENCAISATVLQFAAESLGLGSCWVQVAGRPHSEDDPDGTTAGEYLRENIPGLPPFPALCVVAAGYPAERHKPHELEIDRDKVFFL